MWPPLDFGWTLAEVFKKSQEEACPKENGLPVGTENADEKKDEGDDLNKDNLSDSENCKEGKKASSGTSKSNKPTRRRPKEMEIGTWSNDMAFENNEFAADVEDEDLDELEIFDPNEDLPDNITMLDGQGIPEDIEGELGADWGTGLKERKAKTRPSTASNTTTKKRQSQAGKSSSKTSDNDYGMFRVGSPSNFECDDAYDLNEHNYNSEEKAGGGMYDYDHYGDEDDCDFDDYWDDDSYSEGESDDDVEKLKNNNEWNAKNKRKPEEVQGNDVEEELDLMMGEVDCSELELLENNYSQIIREKCHEMLQDISFIKEEDELKFEKAKRPPLPSSDKVFQKENLNVSSNENLPTSDSFGFDYNCLDKSDTLSALMESSINCKSILYPVGEERKLFSFDEQPQLIGHCGPAPSIILQALTMSNANDGVNLERLETIGDSFLKYAITTYLYCMYPQQHEGKLSYLRSKQVSNLNLYRLGKYKGLGEYMVATKFEPHDNWLPPSYYVPQELEEALIASGVPSGHWNMAELPNLHEMSSEQIKTIVHEKTKLIKTSRNESLDGSFISSYIETKNPEELPIFIPYNLLTQHSIPDKSVADCVEALIGAYLTTCGPKGALLFMSWLGIKVLPSVTSNRQGKQIITFSQVKIPISPLHVSKQLTSSDAHYNLLPTSGASGQQAVVDEESISPLFSDCPHLPSPISLPDPYQELNLLLTGYDAFEESISYKFRDRSYMLQAFTHASFCRNRLTDCYQRLEFLGDAVLGL